MHSRLASRLTMTAEERAAEMRAIEAKMKQQAPTALYGRLEQLRKHLSTKKAVKEKEILARIDLAAAIQRGDITPPVAATEDANENAKKVAEEAAAALIAEEEAEKVVRVKKKSTRKHKQKQSKQCSSPSSPTTPEVLPTEAPAPPPALEAAAAAPPPPPSKAAASLAAAAAVPAAVAATTAAARSAGEEDRVALVTAALSLVRQHHPTAIRHAPITRAAAGTKAWSSAPASRAVSPCPWDSASSASVAIGASPRISPSASVRSASAIGRNAASGGGGASSSLSVGALSSATCRSFEPLSAQRRHSREQSLAGGAGGSVGGAAGGTVAPSASLEDDGKSREEAASSSFVSRASSRDESDDEEMMRDGDAKLGGSEGRKQRRRAASDTTTNPPSSSSSLSAFDEARETSRRQRRAHAAAMGALQALGSASDAVALHSSIAVAELHVRTLPALEEELQVARLRLQALGAEKAAGAALGGGLATISEVADHATHHTTLGDNPSAASALRTASVAVPLAELRAATANFDDEKKVGEGGFASVYRAAHLPSIGGVSEVAIKKHHALGPTGLRLPRGNASPAQSRTAALIGAGTQSLSANQSLALDFTDLQREVALLQRCAHAHLLPLLGHCLERTAPCLVFPLCVGGSLQARLQPAASEHWTGLQRLGFSSVPPPLSWTEILQIVLEASEALSYLHTPTASKPRIVHRDIKPANILLDANLHARLADTGFAKATLHGDERLALSVGQGACYTPGYADPLVINGGEYSAVTDGYAVGITLLVCLTNRSPIAMVDRCEAEFGRAWDDISGHEIAGGTIWPPDVADALKRLCFHAGGSQPSLCADRRRNRSSIEQTMHTLRELQMKASEPPSEPPSEPGSPEGRSG